MLRAIFLLLVSALFCRCVEPTEPVFQLEQPFYLVEGQVADQPGRSKIKVRASSFREVSLEFDPVTDAEVTAFEAAGTQVQWFPQPGDPGIYQPPPDFAAVAGQRWFIRISFADGTVAESSPEVVPPSTSLDGLNIGFDQKGKFDNGRDRFLPVFRVLIDATDDGSRRDFYQWDLRYWELTIICKTCYYGVYREGKCISANIPNSDHYDYLCLGPGPCYQATPGAGLDFANDVGFSGGSMRGREIGTIEFTDFGGLLVEAIQYSITEEAYNYGKVTSDLVNGATGLNATIPAALTGNLSNVSDTDRGMLGYVSAVSVDTLRRFLVRDETTGKPSTSGFERRINLEPVVGLFVPPRAPCRGEGRTLIRPTGWPE